MPTDQDTFGNYIAMNDAADIALEFPPGGSFAGGIGVGTRTGVGSPQGVVSAPPGTEYVDTSNGNFYVKQTGTGKTGWVLVTGAGGGGGGVTSGNGSPVGVVNAATFTLYVQLDSTPPGITWFSNGSVWSQ